MADWVAGRNERFPHLLWFQTNSTITCACAALPHCLTQGLFDVVNHFVNPRCTCRMCRSLQGARRMGGWRP